MHQLLHTFPTRYSYVQQARARGVEQSKRQTHNDLAYATAKKGGTIRVLGWNSYLVSQSQVNRQLQVKKKIDEHTYETRRS